MRGLTKIVIVYHFVSNVSFYGYILILVLNAYIYILPKSGKT